MTGAFDLNCLQTVEFTLPYIFDGGSFMCATESVIQSNFKNTIKSILKKGCLLVNADYKGIG
jgi:hypothetical protein